MESSKLVGGYVTIWRDRAMGASIERGVLCCVVLSECYVTGKSESRRGSSRSYIDAELTLGPSTAVPSLRLPSSYAFMALMVASKVNVISPGRDSNDETEPEDH
jgi:hypothetical protein